MPLENAPLVSVIVPNFNYARYLAERIATIKAQTIDDFELIVLDDASTDESVEIIKQMPPDSRMSLFVNQCNSGSVFKQWNLGIQKARGKYIWIAEADDSSDPAFLETLIAKAEAHSDAAIVYCQSIIIDQVGRNVEPFSKYTDNIDSEKWKFDYSNNGVDEITKYLVVRNTIPNVSACLFRRSALLDVGLASTDLKLCGDWLTYVRLLEKYSIAFSCLPLNRYRRHTQTVRASSREGLLFLETYRVIEYIIKRSTVAAATREFTFKYNFAELRYFVTQQSKGSSWMDETGFYDLARSIDPLFPFRLKASPVMTAQLSFVVTRCFFLKARLNSLPHPGDGTVQIPMKKKTVIEVQADSILYLVEAFFCHRDVRTKIDLRNVVLAGNVQRLSLEGGLKLWLLKGRSTVWWPIPPAQMRRGAHIEISYSEDTASSVCSLN